MKQVYLILFHCVIATANLVQDITKYKIALSDDEYIFGISFSSENSTQLILQKYVQAGQLLESFGKKGTVFLTIPRLIKICLELLPNNDLLIGFIENAQQQSLVILDSNGRHSIIEAEDIITRSCFEYANPITRTFDQLNIRRCMRVGGDLIVCGKIINDPVCNVTPCYTQVER
ncbi:hypothetical protein Noda2021_07570 [Candidatus Dependentiae bacterium Noda2021]|nr:hypothetical protein Noda2021_07570 [Candidatus Dependentiae bacterium Noda2021]